MRVRPLVSSALPLFVTLLLGACSPAPEVVPPPTSGIGQKPDAALVVTRDAAVADASDASAPPAKPVWPYATPVTVKSARGMVVTDNALASQVGKDVLAKGGNAADAAIATAFALAVTYPTAGNLGGGGFAVTKFSSGVRALDFRETAPGAAKRDMYLDANGKPTKDSGEGIKSVGVPGAVAGLSELYKTLGSKKLTWAQLVAPAIALAKDGFVVDAAFVDTLEHGGERLKKHAVSAALFFPDGKTPALGSTFKNPELAATLERIAQKGEKGFYEGPTAQAIVAQMKTDGGLVTAKDLGAYKAKWRTPIEVSYRGNKIVSMPPPSSGGVTLAMILHILEGYDLAKMGFQSPEELHFVFEAMRRSYAARNAKLGDPDFVKLPVPELLSDAWATEQRKGILPDRATPSSQVVTGPSSGNGPHTTHFSVVDADGNAVALTTTINWWFGSGVTVKGGGFLLNNEMDDFAAVPGTANGFGLVQGEPNAIAPGKRMLSSMAPTIVTGPDGKISLVVGGAGGPTIITAVLQEIVNVIDFKMDIGAAVSAPRFHMQHLPDQVAYEKDGLDPETKQKLEAMGYSLKERGHLADAPGIGRLGTEWMGAAEPRRMGGLSAAP